MPEPSDSSQAKTSAKPKLSLEQRLGLNKSELDKESHIAVDIDRCHICTTKVCLSVCPAEVYRLEDEKIVFNHENCIECGTCSIACKSGGKGGINWNNPRGGFGIIYRYG